MKNTFRLVLLLCGVLVLASCNGGSGTSSADEIVIGEYGSLTGGQATFGISTRNGIDIAVDEINAAGGVLGKKVRVVVEDDQGKAEEANVVVTKLITERQGGGGSWRSRVVQQPRCRAGSPAEWHTDDQSFIHESRSDQKGRLHLSSVFS